jgi:2-amino-4-hydroxy-6-hydroxymethyldihydropteridine diphosphokinase
MGVPSSSYAIAIGSNRPGRHGPPAREVAAALAALGRVTAASPIIPTPALGPSIRRYANAVAILGTDEDPPELLARLKAIERSFGRRRGRRWGARVIDLDVILWSGGAWSGPGITVPHPEFRHRGFVLDPLATIAADWRDPLTGLSVRQLHARYLRRLPWNPPGAPGGSSQ